MHPSNLMSQKEVMTLTSLSRTTLWRLEKRKEFPGRLKLSKQKVGWFRKEVEEWLEGRREEGGGDIFGGKK